MKPGELVKQEWPTILLVLFPIPILLLTWSSIPEIIPTHYNAHGQIDGYGHKGFAMAILPVVNLLISLLLYAIPKIDPKKQLSASTPGYKGLRILLSLVFFVIFVITILAATGKPIDVSRALMVVLMLLFIGIGYFMPRLPSNYFAGIRLPWTLEDPENWRKTHIIGGKVAMIGGCIGLVLVLLVPPVYGFVVVITSAISLGLIPAIYSFTMYRKSQQDTKS